MPITKLHKKQIPYNCSELYGIYILLIELVLLHFFEISILDVILWLLCATCLLTACETGVWTRLCTACLAVHLLACCLHYCVQVGNS
jgi:hypothetical protein